MINGLLLVIHSRDYIQILGVSSIFYKEALKYCLTLLMEQQERLLTMDPGIDRLCAIFRILYIQLSPHLTSSIGSVTLS